MPILFFRISKLPLIVDCIKNAAAIGLNVVYPISEENEISFDNKSEFKGEFLDEMEIQVSEDNIIWSSSSKIKIKELVGVNTPESSNEIIAGNKNQSYNLYDLLKFPINASTDRIKIYSITGYGQFKKNNLPLNVGDVIYMHQLQNIVAMTDNGAGIPVMSLYYYCGNHLGFNESNLYVIEINVASLAEISSLSLSGDNPFLETILIENGLSNKTALVFLETTGDMFSSGPASEITVTFPGGEAVITANGTQNINVLLDNEGKANIEVQHNYSNFGVAATSNIKLTIEDVDGDPLNVAGADNYTSTKIYS